MESGNYDSPRPSRRIGQSYADETNEYDYSNSSKRYEQRSGGGGDDGWGSTPSYAKDLEWNDYEDRTKSSDKPHSSRGGGSQKWNSYEGNNRDRGADRTSYLKGGGGGTDKYDDSRAFYSGDRDKYYGSVGDSSSSSNNRSYRESKQYYEKDYPDEWGDRYNYPADNNKKASSYPDSQDWSRNDNKSYSKYDSRVQYPESDSRRYEYNSSSSRGHSDRSHHPPLENDYEQYYSSKSRHEEPSYSRNDDWDRKASYTRGNNDDLKRTATYDSSARGSGGGGYINDNNDNRKRPRSYPDDYGRGGGQKYPPPSRGYKGSAAISSPKSNDYKRLKSYDDGKSSSGRYDEGPKDYSRQPGNESPSEFADEPLWEGDRFGMKINTHSKAELEDPNDPWGAPPESTDPNHWDNFWEDSWGPKPVESNTEGNRR